MITQSQAGRSHLLLLGGALLTVGALALGLWLGQRQSAPDWAAAVFYPAPRDIAGFELTAADGEPFGNRDLEGAWDLVFFGFTHCPDVCPNTLGVLREVRRRLDAQGVEPPRVTLVSVDPERDRPEVMDQYVRFFDPEFRAATGSPEALAALTRDVGVAFHVEPHEAGAESYAVDHGAAVLIVDPEGRLRGQLRPPPDVETFASDLARLIAG